MKFNHYTLLSSVLLLFCLNACKDDDVAPEKPAPEPEPKEVIVNEWVTIDKKKIVNVKDLKIESSRRTFVYFSLEGMKIIDAEKVKTNEWDIAFTLANAANIYANTGQTTNTDAPYYQGAGRAVIAFVTQNFDDVTAPPADDQFDQTGKLAFGIRSSGAPEEPFFWANYMYDEKGFATHSVPYPNKTLIIKLTDGRYAKLQYQSNYKGGLTNPTAADHIADKLGYCSFRYFISKAGSKDLTTK
ncbi:HmuY family protein [Pedobacter faecalis]|uniref:HmuY family protein n=1 Tax=Pedobacter faecalis TaxID=3041495 RepID=UPI00254C0AB2|nr:HmuY family protein [Pedobacter sp. ELA7]